jgi:hypothetical protein
MLMKIKGILFILITITFISVSVALSKEEWKTTEDPFSEEFYNQIIFPLEMSDKPVRAVYYNRDLIKQEELDKISRPIKTDFISPTCVRIIYDSWLAEGNQYWLYFVNKQLRLASLLPKGANPKQNHMYDVQMLSNVDPSIYQAKVKILDRPQAAVHRKSVLENYIDNMPRDKEYEANQDYRNSMLNIEKEKLEIMRKQRNNYYN